MITELAYKELIDQYTETNFYMYEIDSVFVKGTPEYEEELNSQRTKFYDLYPKFVQCMKRLKVKPKNLDSRHEETPIKWDSFMDDWDIFIP